MPECTVGEVRACTCPNSTITSTQACNSTGFYGACEGCVAPTTVLLTLTADNTSLPLGRTGQVTATVTYDDNSTEDVTKTVTWISSNAEVATVATETELAGLVITGKVGQTQIGAQLGNFIEYLTIDVTAPSVVSIKIESSKGYTLGLGQSVQLKAFATRSDETRTDVTNDISWICSDGSIALLNDTGDKGFLSTRAVGTITVTAKLGQIESSKQFEVSDAVPLSLELRADHRRIAVGTQTVVSAEGTYSDGSKRNLSTLVTWASSDTSAATINESGVVTAVARGESTITAVSDNNLMTHLDISSFEPGDCDYPTPFDRIKEGETMPQLVWADALLADETPIYFSMEQFACADQWAAYTSVAFILSTGWCPNCPDYNRMVSNQAAALATAGMLVVFSEAETSSRQAPTSRQAFDMMANWGVSGPGVRVGDGATEPLPFAIKAWASAYPSAFVVRKSDMKVLDVNPRQVGLMPIAQNPDNY